MRNRPSIFTLSLVAFLATTGSALAEKPSWAGGSHGKHEKQERYERQPDNSIAVTATFYFSDGDRRVVSDYYGAQARAGKCPPGLAKKNNGCLPPGQAKKWARGHPLAAGVYFTDLPAELLRRLPPPPPKHRYVQVAGDVLMIAIGTSMVVDALEDLMR